MKTARLFVIQMVVLSWFAVSARTVSITSSDLSSGSVELAISAGEADEADKALIAAWAPGGMANSPTNAREIVSVATVDAATTSASFTLPDAWRAKSGMVQFFLMSQTAPYAKRFNYLRTSAASCWIDTGVVPDTNTDVSVSACYPGDVAPFGVSGKFYFFSNAVKNGTGTFYCGFFGANNGGAGFSAPRSTTTPQTFRLNSSGAMIDGVKYYVLFDPTNFTQSTTSTFTLFARKADGKASVAKQGDITIYSAQIRSAGVLTHDYVPCEKSDGTRTLYDRVTGTFSAVSGTGSFVAGEEVGPDPRDCGTLESATEPLRFAPEIAIVSKDLATGAVTISIADGHDEGLLLVVGDAADAGTTYSSWANHAFLMKVPAETNAVTVTLPSAWWNAGYTIRALWKSADGFGYDRELESVSSTGSAYLLTEWQPTPHSDVTVVGRSAADVCLTGLTTYFYFFCNGGSTFYGFFGNNGSCAAITTTTSHAFRLGPSGAFLDGELKAGPFTNTTFVEMTKPLPLPYRRDSSTGDFNKKGTAWIQSAQFREREELVRDYVPCVSNGVAGLYDRVHGTFSPSSTSTAFMAGEEVVPATGDDDVLAWSSTLSLLSAAATWDAGGADTRFSTAANWDGDVVPNFTSGLVALTFATAGTSAEVVGPTSVRGLLFNAANDFALSPADATSVLSIGVGGISLTDNPSETIPSGSWRYARITGPVEVAGDQIWDLSTNVQRRLQFENGANIRGDADRTLTIEGSGTLGLCSTNDFEGNVQINGGTLKLLSRKQPFGSASAGGKVVCDLSKGAVWNQFGAVIDKPLEILGAGSDAKSSLFLLDGQAYGTNWFTSSVTVSLNTLKAQLWGTTVFSGGLDLQASLALEGSGTVVFKDEPITRSANQGITFLGARETHVYSTNNSAVLYFNNDATTNGNRLHLWNTNSFGYFCDLLLGHGTVVDLHGTTQNFGDLAMDSAADCVTSSVPSEIFCYYDSWDAKNLLGRFMGPVTFKKSGKNTATLKGANTSTGTLVAQNGTLVIGGGGSWAGTDVQIGQAESNRKPTLRLTHSDVFADARHTTITMTTSTSKTFYTDCGSDPAPVLSLDEGVELHVKHIVLDGHTLAGGWWGGANSTAEHKDATHFAGTGKVFVIGAGTWMIFR